MRLTSLVVAIAIILISGYEASAKRVALVMGNNNYDNVPKLQKAVNDAKAMASTLTDLGFAAILAEDLSRRDMNRKLQEFSSKIGQGDEVLLYYAGHGVEIANRIYLLPTDIPKAKPGEEEFVTSEAIAVDRILRSIKSRGARVSILVLDACRENPFPSDGTRSVGATRGIGRVNPPEGTFIFYSADFGQLALDRLNDGDDNPNSVYTRTLIPLLKTPGMTLPGVAQKVRRDVKKLAATVSHKQQPAYYDGVLGEFYFTPGGSSSSISPSDPIGNADQNLWNTIKDSKKATDFEFYLKEYPKGLYAAVARLKLQRLKEQKVAVGIYPETPQASSEQRLPFEPEMVRLPGGTFQMGCVSGKSCFDSEKPVRSVTIKPFEMGEYEVTRDQFQAFVDATGYKTGNKCWIYEGKWVNKSGRSYLNPGFTQTGDHPVVCVSWDDAEAYAKWLSKKTGKQYRLPTEAEWEYAARAGSERPFWWGGSISTDQANYDGNYTFAGSKKGSYRKKTVSVDSFKPNKFGLYNVHGNVSEWTQDCWHNNYKGAPTNGSAWLKVDGGNCAKRVLRGGSWNYEPRDLRSANRSRVSQVNRNYFFGFRLSRTLR